MGNKTLYTAEIAEAILTRLANGETLRAICRDEGMPSAPAVHLWVLDDREGFAERYARAREIGAYAMADELIDIVDDGTNDWMTRRGRDGETEQVLNSEHVQRSRLRADKRQWLLSKVLPRVFGDKLDVTSKGERVSNYVIPAPPEAADAVEWATQHKPR